MSVEKNIYGTYAAEALWGEWAWSNAGKPRRRFGEDLWKTRPRFL